MSTDAWQLLLTHMLGREEIISNLYQFGKSLLQTDHHRLSLLINVRHKVGRSVPPTDFSPFCEKLSRHEPEIIIIS